MAIAIIEAMKSLKSLITNTRQPKTTSTKTAAATTTRITARNISITTTPMGTGTTKTITTTMKTTIMKTTSRTHTMYAATFSEDTVGEVQNATFLMINNQITKERLLVEVAKPISYLRINGIIMERIKTAKERAESECVNTT